MSVGEMMPERGLVLYGTMESAITIFVWVGVGFFCFDLGCELPGESAQLVFHLG